MNVPKAIELALAEVLRNYGDVGEGVCIRAWQSLAADGSWNKTVDRVLPLIDVRCSPPMSDETQATLRVDATILCGTAADDDRDHARISDLYGSVQENLDSLFSQFRSGINGDELTAFLASIAANVDSGKFTFGGFTFGTAIAPYDDKGANMIGITLSVHYSRSDY